MKLDILNLQGQATSKIDLPKQFDEQVRIDLIKRALLVIQANKRQPYGALRKAGMRHSATLSRRRKDYKRAYGIGISRVPRKVMWKRGTQFGFVGAFAPGMVGGRRAHPPKSSKDLSLKMNIKEKKKAIRSAIAGTKPIITETDLEKLSKTKEVKDFIKKIGLGKELQRTEKRKVRAGKGKSRGRKYKTKKGILIVVSKKCPLINSAKNIPGLDIQIVKLLNVQDLAPGAKPGRQTIYTKDSLEKMEEDKLFM